MHHWLRETYEVRERSVGHPTVRAFENGLEVGRWLEGQRVPLVIWERYLAENPEMKQSVEKNQRHHRMHYPLHISLR